MSGSTTRARTSGTTPVHFLTYNIDARDGVCRAVVTLANALAERHPVEIISLYRRDEGPAYAVSDRVRVRYLFDHPAVPRAAADQVRRPAPRYRRRISRHAVRNRLARRPSQLSVGYGFPNLSALTDRVLAEALYAVRDGVVISTRPALHVAAARLTRPGVVTIGQDHLNFESRSKEIGSMALIELACRNGLDAFVTLTSADTEDYSRTLPARTRVTSIPNALSWPISEPRERTGAHDSRTIIAAGRLVPRKGMGRLIRAFAPVARKHPDWRLRIYGHGRLEAKLAGIVAELGVGDQVTLEGYTSELPAAFAGASVYACASAAEGFPMVMLEALSTGLPIVSFDCPRGPRDIIRDGVNGRLVANGDIPALSAALEQVVADDALRASMSAQALRDAELYLPERIADRWEHLIAELLAPAALPLAG
ncbi:MAG: glycosyltransferase family 4 protein [Marmoricola sp.]